MRCRRAMSAVSHAEVAVTPQLTFLGVPRRDNNPLRDASPSVAGTNRQGVLWMQGGNPAEKRIHRLNTRTAYGSPPTPKLSIGSAKPNVPSSWKRTVQLQECPRGPFADAESNTDGANRRRSNDDIRRPRKWL